MAKAKKKAKKKTAKKTAKKTSSAKAAKKTSKTVARRARPGRPGPRVLTTAERLALVGGREGWRDVVDDVGRAMQARKLRVEGVSPAKLVSLAARAAKAKQREEELVEKQARALAPVADARRLADDAAWRAMLDVLATVRFKARKDPSLLDDFTALIELMKNEPAAKEEPSA